MTVIGGAGLNTDASAPAVDFAFEFSLPTPPPVPLSLIKFGAPAAVSPVFVSSLCTGTFIAPTAPAGMVCVYVATSTNTKSAAAAVNYPLSAGVIRVGFSRIAAGQTFLTVSWAYTRRKVSRK